MPMKPNPPDEIHASGSNATWLSNERFDFSDFAAFLLRHDPRWVFERATRSASISPDVVDQNASESAEAQTDGQTLKKREP